MGIILRRAAGTALDPAGVRRPGSLEPYWRNRFDQSHYSLTSQTGTRVLANRCVVRIITKCGPDAQIVINITVFRPAFGRNAAKWLRSGFVPGGRWHYGPPVFGYVFSIALTAIAGIMSLAMLGPQPVRTPFLLFYPFIALASFSAGAAPGLAAAFGTAIFVSLFFSNTPGPVNWVALAILGPLLAMGFAHVRYIRQRGIATARELERFKFIGDHASDWILLLDALGSISYANHMACAGLGWTDQQLKGRRIESLVPEWQGPDLTALLGETRSGMSRPIEVTFERADKSLVLTELGCTAIHTQGDQVIYAVARDITERKKIDQKLQEVRRWESLGVLAGGLAHDLNNLLTSILGNAFLVREHLVPDHVTGPLLDGIVVAGERSADLIRMLLATSGYRPRYNEQLELDQILDGMLASRSLPSNIRLSRETDGAAFTGDRRSFDTLLWSLISNAADAYGKDDGEVRVTIRAGIAPETGRASFEEGDAAPGEGLGIVVEDRGAGMGPEVLARAFDPFFSTKFTGRGLGLPAVRGIVRAYSGKLCLQTATGKGTRVEVWLPFANGEG
jgi:PAS domain S-box-containing protein